MRLPKPHDDEDHDEFIDRCIGDEEMQEFDDPAQRRAVCESQRRKDKEQGMKGSYILQAAMETPWAILPNKLAVIVEVISRHVSGEKLDAEEVQQRIHGARRPQDRQTGSIAIIPLFGTIFPRANMMTQMSGATSAELFGRSFAQIIHKPDISSVIIDVDSAGGQVTGVDELSKQIFDARGSKPIVAVANHLAASAAYWIASAADELVVTPSGEVGSIGVFAIHEDLSDALAHAGVKVSLISEGKYKTEGNPFEPLTEEARIAIQGRVGEYYSTFIKSVARNRGIKPSEVRDGFGEGRLVGAHRALQLGMADRIATLDETIQRLHSARPKRRIGADLEMRRRRLRLAEKR